MRLGTRNQKSASLRHQLFWVVVGPMAIVIGCMLILWSVGTSYAISHAQRLAEAQLRLNADRFTDSFSHTADMLEMIGRIDAVQSRDKDRVIQTLRNMELAAKPDVEGLYYAQLDGHVYATDGTSFDAHDRYYFPIALKNQTVITRSIRSRATGHDISAVIVPIYDQTGHRIGTIGAAIPINKLIELATRLLASSDDLAFIVDDSGQAAAGSRDCFSGRFLTKDEASRYQPFLKALRQTNSSRPQSQVNHVRYNGADYTFFYQQIKDTPWTIGLARSDSSIYQKRNQTAIVSLAILAVLACVAAAINRYLYKRLISPLISIGEVMERFREGHLKERIKIETDNEIGRVASDFNRLAGEFESTVLRDQLIVRSAAVCIIGTDANGLITHFNRASEKLTGYQAEEVIGKRTPTIFHHQDEIDELRKSCLDTEASDWALIRENALKYGETGRECIYMRKDGSKAHVHLTATPIVNSSGEIQGYLGIGRDVTDLRETERCFENLMNVSPLGVVVAYSDKIAYVNKEMCDILGYPREHLIGKDYINLIASSDQARVENERATAEYGKVFRSHFVGTGVKADGTEFTFEARVSEVVYMGTPAHVAVVTDITDRLKAEADKERRRARNDRYAQFMNDIAEKLGASNKDYASSIASATEATCALLDAHHAGVWLYSNDYQQITCVDAFDTRSSTHEKDWSYDTELFRDYIEALKREVNVTVNDVESELRASPELLEYFHKFNIKAFMDIPLRYDGTLKGVLSIEVRDEVRHWDGDDIQYALSLAAVITVCLESTERQRAEQALRESESNLKTLINAMPDIICFKDGRGAWIVANEFGLDLFGLTDVAYQGKKDTELAEFSPFYLDTFRVCEETDEVAWKSDTYTRGNETIPKQDGTSLTFDLIKVPIFNEDGSRQGLIVVGRDITERVEAENRLRDILERIQVLSKNLPNGILYEVAIDHDGNRTVTYISEGAEAMLGSPAEEIYKDASLLYRSFVPDDLPGLYEAEEKAARECLVFRYEARFLTSTGEVHWALMSSAPRRVPDGTIVFDGIVLDVTEHRRAEENLIQSEKRWQFALEGAGDGVYDWDIVNNKVFYSSRLKSMLGYEDEDWTDDPMEGESRLHPEEQVRVESQIIDFIEGRTPIFSAEYRLRCKDGSYKWVLDRGMILSRDDSGKPTRVIGTHADISEKIAYEEQIRLLNADLERRVEERTHELGAAMRELESFAYSISHDLRAPLRAIDGYTHILMDDHREEVSSDATELLDRISLNARKMGQLIDDLLAFSRIGRAEIRKERIDLSGLCQEIAHDLLPFSDRERYSIEIEPSMAAHGDQVLIRQVVQNLLANAIKFSSRKDKPEISIRLESMENETVCSFRDNGAGFNMAYIDQLFGVFQRLHSSNEFEGTGVGLAIVKRIIERHGGRVWAEAEVGSGAVFSFALPKERPTDQ